MRDVLARQADRREAEPGVEVLRRVADVRADQYVSGATGAYVVDGVRDDRAGDAAAAEGRQGEEILDHADTIVAQHGGAVGAINVVPRGEEELIRGRLVAVV